MSLPGVQTEKTMLAERDQQIRAKVQQKALDEVRETEELLQHYQNYKLGGSPNPELESLLLQKRAELEVKKRALGISSTPQSGSGAPIAFDMNSKEATPKLGKDLLFAQRNAQNGMPVTTQESERDRRLRLRAEERARKLTGNTTSAYSVSSPIDRNPQFPGVLEQAGTMGRREPQYWEGKGLVEELPIQYRQNGQTEEPIVSYERKGPVIPGPDLREEGRFPANPERREESYPEPNPQSLSFGGQTEDKKEKQRRYKEELDRQQMERRPPRPGRTASYDALPTIENPGIPSQQPDQPPGDEKREKQRRYKEELDRLAAAKATVNSAERTRDLSAGNRLSHLPPAPYQSGGQYNEDDPRVREYEKKQRYAQELREMMEEKARIKDSENEQVSYQYPPMADPRLLEAQKKSNYARQLEEQIRQRPVPLDDRPPLYPDPPSQQDQRPSLPDPVLERKQQYKADLQKQMEEQRLRREEEKRRLKEQALKEEARFLAEAAEAKKASGKKVSDPNKPSSDHPNAERYGQLMEKRRMEIDYKERPIGVLEGRGRPSREGSYKSEEPPSPQYAGRQGIFEPAKEDQKPVDLLSQYPSNPVPSYPYSQPQSFPQPQAYPPPQTYGQSPQFQPSQYHGDVPSSAMQNIEKYYREIQEIKVERDKAKEEMLELREMMLKEKENRLEEMIKLISAQALGHTPPMYPYGQQPFSPPANQWSGYPPPNQFPQSASNPPVSVPPKSDFLYTPPTSQPSGDEFGRPFPSPRFPDQGYDSIRQVPAIQNPSKIDHEPDRQDLPIRKPVSDLLPGPGNQQFFEESLRGSSKWVDPASMKWGTTKLLQSVQKLPELESKRKPWSRPNQGGVEVVDMGKMRDSEELGESLPSTVEHVPIPQQTQDPGISRIEELIQEGSDEDEETLPQNQEPVTIPTPSGPISVTDSISSSSTNNRKEKTNPFPDPDPQVPSEEDMDLCNIKSAIELTTPADDLVEPPPIDPAPPRTSSASRSRPRTLDAFKGKPVAKIPARRQVLKEKRTAPEENQGTTALEDKPSFHRLQDLRDRKKQEKPRDILDNLGDALEKLSQQRKDQSDSASLESSASNTQSQFESRFKVLAMNELKVDRGDSSRPLTAPKSDGLETPLGSNKDILDQFVEAVSQASSRPQSKSSSRRYTEEPDNL